MSERALERATLAEAYERACAAYSNALVAEYDAETTESANPSTDVHTPLHKAIDATREARVEMHRTREALQAWDREHTEPPPVLPLWLANLTPEAVARINAIHATGPLPWDIADGALAAAIAGPATDSATEPALCAEVRRLRRKLSRAEEWIRSGAEKIKMIDGDIDGACANARAFADELRADLLNARQATRDATALGVKFEGVADKLSDIGDRQAAEIQRLRQELWQERARSEADEVTLDPRQYRWELTAHEVAERVQSRAIIAADDATGELLDALLTSGVPSLVGEIRRLMRKNRSLHGKLIETRQKLAHAWKSSESMAKSLAYAQRQLEAAQRACPHPVDDRAPVSGDGWICERCSAWVDAPPPHVADGDWNSEAVAAAIMVIMRYPAPLLTVVAQALNLAPALADVKGGPGKVADAWRDILHEAKDPAGRDALLTIAMLAIHGAMACDAEAAT